MVLKINLLGSGIEHSRMPQLQEYLGNICGIAINYGKVDAGLDTDFSLAEVIEKSVRENFTGLNITHPYKSDVVGLVSRSIIPEHVQIGSFNILKFENGEILGANTDYSGFIRAYKKYRNQKPPGKVFLVGAGGVGRAIAFALAALGCSELFIYDRRENQAQILARNLEQKGLNACVVTPGDMASAVSSADGLVNCTEMGMYNHPGSAIDARLISNQQWAFDAVYTPMETEFLSKCREAGLLCISGYYLWIYQGLDAFTIFTGIEIKPDEKLLETTLSWQCK